MRFFFYSISFFFSFSLCFISLTSQLQLKIILEQHNYVYNVYNGWIFARLNADSLMDNTLCLDFNVKFCDINSNNSNGHGNEIDLVLKMYANLTSRAQQ